MAINLDDRYPGRANPKNLSYPQGSFKNRTAPNSGDGTYLEQDWANDQLAFFQSLMVAAGMTANGSVDTAQASQYFDALLQTIRDMAATNAQRGTIRTATETETRNGAAGDIATTPSALASIFPVRGMQTYSEPGTYSWTVPQGVTQILISGCGGGGGGGGSGGGSSSNRSGGGCGGGAGKAQLPTLRSVTPGTTLSITVGAGGNGGSRGSSGSGNGGSGSNGGNTTVTNMIGGTLTLQGGSGGGGSASSGAGGVFSGSGYPIGQQGATGTDYYSGYGGDGGGGPFGAAGHGAPAAGTTSNGYDAEGNGCGGGGAGGVVATSNQQGYMGGAGAPGMITIVW